MEKFGTFYGHCECIYYGHLVILWQFDIFSPVLVYCVEKNLATLPANVSSTYMYLGSPY
jgi:hypothetical protein